jgi:transcriptional regulator with XRE-family HTH domain
MRHAWSVPWPPPATACDGTPGRAVWIDCPDFDMIAQHPGRRAFRRYEGDWVIDMANKRNTSSRQARGPEDSPKQKQEEYPRLSRSNALGQLIERRFREHSSPCRSYSDLERQSGISREALSRYVTTRADRRRSPTIDTLVAITDALHLGLEETCRAAAAATKGLPLQPPAIQRSRVEVLTSLVETLSEGQFGAVVELLRQMHPATPGKGQER